MFAKETGRADGMEVVAIMTPNDSHCACRGPRFVRASTHRDKPLATNLEARSTCQKRVKAPASCFCRRFNDTGFPLIRQAAPCP